MKIQASSIQWDYLRALVQFRLRDMKDGYYSAGEPVGFKLKEI